MSQRTILLVRHAQTDRSTPPKDKLGNGLTQLGREQAELTGRRLAELPVTAIHHSTAHRAGETAGIIAIHFPGVPLLVDPVLLECIPAYTRAFAEWYSNLSPQQAVNKDLHVPPEMELWLGMEELGTEWKTWQEGALQAGAAFEKYFKLPENADEYEIVVCHGNIIRYFMLRTLQAPPELWINSDIYNCGICEVVITSDSKMQLISFNDSGHLPSNMRVFV